MATAKISTACLSAGEIIPVTVEVDIRPGLPTFRIIGLPSRTVGESRERIRAAFKNSGLRFPSGHLTVNLIPAEIPKKTTLLELPIALAIAVVQGLIPKVNPCYWVLGELSLTGVIRAHTSLPAFLLESTRVPVSCVIATEAASMAQTMGSSVLLAATLMELCAVLKNGTQPTVLVAGSAPPRKLLTEYALDAVFGQESVKRVMALALAGQHNLLLTGPAGVGKTMLIQAAEELLPSLSQQEYQERLALMARFGGQVQVAGWQRPLVMVPPRSTPRTLLGDGVRGILGAASSASGGVLFLDEYAELAREVRESLRTLLEERVVRLAGQHGPRLLPGPRMVWAAMNSCSCGKAGIPGETCTCSASERLRYQAVLSEPMRDRFTLFYQVGKVDLTKKELYQPSAEVRGAFLQKNIARCWQARTKGEVPAFTEEADLLLRTAAQRLGFSVRVTTRLRAVAETVALWDEKVSVDSGAVREVLQYRPRAV